MYEEVVKEDNIISYSDREVRDLIRISDFRRTANKIVLPMLIFFGLLGYSKEDTHRTVNKDKRILGLQVQNWTLSSTRRF